eukprot:1472944-Amphidinium_carterae.1
MQPVMEVHVAGGSSHRLARMQLESAAPSSPSELPVPTDISAPTSPRQASVAPTSPPSPISVPPLQVRMHHTDAHALTEVPPPTEGVVRPYEEASAALPTDVPLLTDVPPPTDFGRRTQEDEAI